MSKPINEIVMDFLACENPLEVAIELPHRCTYRRTNVIITILTFYGSDWRLNESNDRIRYPLLRINRFDYEHWTTDNNTS